MRRDTGQSYREYLEGLAQAEGIETPTRQDVARLDKEAAAQRLGAALGTFLAWLQVARGPWACAGGPFLTWVRDRRFLILGRLPHPDRPDVVKNVFTINGLLALSHLSRVSLRVCTASLVTSRYT